MISSQPPIRILQSFLYTVQSNWLADSLVLLFTDYLQIYGTVFKSH